VIDHATPDSAALNMAIDEVLLKTTLAPLLRFYRWSEPSVSFGYFGKFHEAREFARGRALVRRWTGGGIVSHGDDFTYSVIIPASDSASRFSSGEIYRMVHDAIARSLRAVGIQTSLAQDAAPKMSDSCFANPVVADVIEAGHKIAGAAHRKTRDGLLHQGSIQRRNLDQRFHEKLASALSNEVRASRPTVNLIEMSEKLAAEKYATQAWLRRR
jgi:lipoyl(octanoyl) transferase